MPLPNAGLIRDANPNDTLLAGVEPLDYEEYVASHRLRDPLAHLVEFPRDDIEVKVVPRKIRTMGHVLPEEPM